MMVARSENLLTLFIKFTILRLREEAPRTCGTVEHLRVKSAVTLVPMPGPNGFRLHFYDPEIPLPWP